MMNHEELLHKDYKSIGISKELQIPNSRKEVNKCKMVNKTLILSLFLFMTWDKVHAQNSLLTEDSVFSFIKVKSDSIISIKYPLLKNYRVKISFTIDSNGNLKKILFYPIRLEDVALQNDLKKTFCKLKYKEIHNYLYSNYEFRNGKNVLFEIVYRYER